MGLPHHHRLFEAVGQCDEHGDFTEKTFGDRAPRCPHCVEREVRDRQAAARASGDRSKRLLSAAGIPTRYLDARIEAVGSHEALVREWVERAVKEYAPMVILGHMGKGKTYTAVAALRILCERGIPVLYGTEEDYLASIRETWSSKEISEGSVFRRWALAQVLVLDDLGAARSSENDVLRVSQLIDHRYRNELTTVFISNLQPEALRAAVGDRAYDRIRDDATQLVLSGESRRQPR